MMMINQNNDVKTISLTLQKENCCITLTINQEIFDIIRNDDIIKNTLEID